MLTGNAYRTNALTMDSRSVDLPAAPVTITFYMAPTPAALMRSMAAWSTICTRSCALLSDLSWYLRFEGTVGQVFPVMAWHGLNILSEGRLESKVAY